MNSRAMGFVWSCTVAALAVSVDVGCANTQERAQDLEEQEQGQGQGDIRAKGSSEETAGRPGAAEEMPRSMCPVALQGVTVRTVDVAEGVALEMTADTEEQVRALQQRARRMVAHHQAQQPRMTGQQGRGRGGMGRGGMGPMPWSRVSVEEMTDGARLVFEAEDSDDVNALRRQLQRRAERMQGGTCPRGMMWMERGA